MYMYTCGFKALHLPLFLVFFTLGLAIYLDTFLQLLLWRLSVVGALQRPRGK